MSPYLTKSNFKVARTWAVKLYYLKNNYPSTNADNDYLELLADGGFMVGKLAKLLHPGGVEINTEDGTRAAVKQTQNLLERDNVILYEAALSKGKMHALVDVLVKEGNRIELIEVKSKSFDGAENQRSLDMNGHNCFLKNNKSGIKADWVEYLEDITFQYLLCKDLYPDAEVVPYLL